MLNKPKNTINITCQLCHKKIRLKVFGHKKKVNCFIICNQCSEKIRKKKYIGGE